MPVQGGLYRFHLGENVHSGKLNAETTTSKRTNMTYRCRLSFAGSANLARCLAFSLLGLGVMLFPACGGKKSSGGNNNNITYCEDDNECGPGEVCRGNQCTLEGDGGAPDSTVSEPDIELSTDTLDFESPLIGAEVVLPLTIQNVGTADLEISLIEIIETGGPSSPQEYHSSEEGQVAITIPPNGEHLLNVSLQSVDDELDLGELRIHSNDPNENPVSVDLVSEHKGVADIAACATAEASTLPVAPYLTYPFDATDCVLDNDDDPLIDFGLVQFEEPQRRILALYNVAEGNAPLTINTILLTNNSGNAGSFSVTFWLQDESTGEATTVGLPFFLSAGDLMNGVNPTVLYVAIDFDASVDVFPLEQLEIQTNDPDESQVFIDIVGVLTGCPLNYWDINGDPNDGCEYFCEFLGSTESCLTPGEDDNCNGEVDEEDADNCTVYFRDHDGDSYGDANDSRCLCATDGEYNVGVGGDCDDDDEFVRPGVMERCITPYDDNCDGSDNDVGAQGCTNYLRDEDGDGYGVTGDSECLCYNAGFYTASMGGDCDDDPLTCGVNCNPGMAEQCSTTDDDNCNGDNNEMNAPGCTTYYRDGDGDGYGHQSLSQCWCYANGDYNSTDPSDCNDGDNGINPSVTEICDTIDNNCVGGVDEGFDLQTDVTNCGSCNHTCVNPHGTTVCLGGVCDPTCTTGWGNCDGVADNGCERDLNTVTFCGSCSIHADCPGGFFCNVGTCEKKWNNGHACAEDVNCNSGMCRDGVCCDANCAGLCRSCAISGSLGSCSYHSAGSDPETDCSSTASNTCGLNGQCDGSGACQFWASGTECAPESCTGTTHEFADTCNGFGACSDIGSEDCSPYVCGTTTCRTDCINDTHCVAGHFCSGGTCTPQTGLGDPCTNDTQCATGHCEDNVCCNRECGGDCRACNLSGNVGTCIDHASGSDPEGGCGLCRVCDGSGSCSNATNGTDPKNNCSQQTANTCGRDGQCDGSGACREWASGTICQPQSCGSHIVTLPWTCNGSGSCLGNGTSNCTPYECNGVVCGTSCGGDGDCIAGYFCNGSSVCEIKKGLGVICTGGTECNSGNCVDGVCCNGTCGGACRSCNKSGSLGICTNHSADTDPEDECSGTCRSCNGLGSCDDTSSGVDPESECADESQASCGEIDACNGSGGCAYWPSGTLCQSQTCVGSVEYPADYCNGSGTCVNSGSTDCHPYMCNGNNCRSNCTLDGHCVTGYYCELNTCCLGIGSDSGATCGTGTLFTFTNNNSTPEGTNITGNLVGVSERWYRFRAVENADDLNIWAWLENNPSSEFKIDVRITDSTNTTCGGTPTNPGCNSSDYQFQWYHAWSGPWQSDDSKTIYVRVYRTGSITCNSYQLNIRVGGTVAPW